MVIFIIVFIIKVNIIKIYVKNTHFITRKFAITRTFIKTEYIIIRVQSSKKFFSSFTCNKAISNKSECYQTIISRFITQSLSFILIRTSIKWFYKHKRIFQNSSVTNLLIGSRIKQKMTFFNGFITHFLSLKLIRIKLNYWRISINSFITLILRFISLRNKF